MMRFITDYEKYNNMRNMEFSLLFFLTADVIVAIFEYIFMESTLSDNYIHFCYHLFWIANLLNAMVFFRLLNTCNFAYFLYLLRVVHINAIAYVFVVTKQLPVSLFVAVLSLVEFIYLMKGLCNERMSFPGKWIAKMSDERQMAKEIQNIEKTRDASYTNYGFEMDSYLANYDDDVTDELFDYYTALDDSMSSVGSVKKHRGTFII